MCPRVYLILACDMRRLQGETRDPLTRTSHTAKKTKADEARHERPGYTKASEASVSIYILVLALSQVLLARVYSRHNLSCRKRGTKHCFKVFSSKTA